MSLSVLQLDILTPSFTGYQTRLAVNERASQYNTVERSTSDYAFLQHPAYVESKVIISLKQTYDASQRAMIVWYYKNRLNYLNNTKRVRGANGDLMICINDCTTLLLLLQAAVGKSLF